MLFALASFIFSFPESSVALIYCVLFFILVFSGVGLPIPEEVTALFAGYLAYIGVLDIWITLYVLLLGNLLGDTIGYLFGRFSGNWFYDKLLRHFRITNLLLQKGEQYFKRYGETIVLFTRPLMGVRFMVPILAGHYKMKFSKFIFFDFLITVPWTFFIVFISYSLGTGLEWISETKEIRHGIFVVVGLAVLLFLALQYRRQGKADIKNSLV